MSDKEQHRCGKCSECTKMEHHPAASSVQRPQCLALPHTYPGLLRRRPILTAEGVVTGSGPQLPPAHQPPANQPPANQPPAHQPPANQPPALQPPANQPPAHQPPPTVDAGNQPAPDRASGASGAVTPLAPTDDQPTDSTMACKVILIATYYMVSTFTAVAQFRSHHCGTYVHVWRLLLLIYFTLSIKDLLLHFQNGRRRKHAKMMTKTLRKQISARMKNRPTHKVRLVSLIGINI